MSKAKLKKYLQTLPQEHLIEVISDLYDARKSARDYLEFFLNPDAAAELEKVSKALSRAYFTPHGRPRARFNTKEGNAIVADFISLDVAPEYVADLMLLHVDLVIRRLLQKRIISETAWNTAVNLFKKAADYTISHGLEEKFSRRIENLIALADKAPSWLRVQQRMIFELKSAASILNPDSDDVINSSDSETIVGNDAALSRRLASLIPSIFRKNGKK